MNVSHANESRESCCAAAYTPEWYPERWEDRQAGNLKPNQDGGGRKCVLLGTHEPNQWHTFFVSKNWLLGFFLVVKTRNKTQSEPEHFWRFSNGNCFVQKTYPCRWNHRLRSLGNRYRWSCPRYWYTERTRHKVDTCTHFRLEGGREKQNRCVSLISVKKQTTQ